jgi:hypothetical protein
MPFPDRTRGLAYYTSEHASFRLAWFVPNPAKKGRRSLYKMSMKEARSGGASSRYSTPILLIQFNI